MTTPTAPDSVELRGSVAFLLDTPPACFRVASGRVLVFRAAVDGGQVVGRRRPVTAVGPGDAVFGAVGESSRERLIAVAEETAVLRAEKSPAREDLQAWLTRLAVPFGGVGPADPAFGDTSMSLPEGATFAAPAGLHWLHVDSGEVGVFGRADLVVAAGGPAVPVPGGTELVGRSTARVRLVAAGTNPAAGLARLHDVLLAAMADGAADHPEAEAARVAARRAAEEAGTESAVRYLRGETPTLLEPAALFDENHAAISAVAATLGVRVPEVRAELFADPLSEPAEVLARAAGLRARRLRLPADWYLSESESFVGLLDVNDELRPVAVLSTPAGYRVYCPFDGETRPLDGDLAARLAPDAVAVHRAFPARPLSLLDLPLFALRGRFGALVMLLALMLGYTVLGALIPQAVRLLIDAAIPDASTTLLAQIGLALAAVHLGQATFLLSQGLLAQRLQSLTSVNLQTAVWDRLLRLPLEFFRRFSGGDLLNRCRILEEACHALSGSVVRTVLTGVLSLFYLAILFAVSPMLGLLAAAVALFDAALTFAIGWAVAIRTLELARVDGGVFGFVVQLINGVGKIRTAGAEGRAFVHWTRRFSDYLRLTTGIRFLEDVGNVANFAVPTLATLLLFYLGGPLAKEGGGLTAGTFLAFLTLFGLVLAGLTQLSETLLEVVVVLGRGKLLEPLLREPLEDDPARMPPGRLRGEVAVTRLTFRYREGGPAVLDDVSFSVRPGEFVAVVGPSGSGKSTLLRLMLGLEKPTFGTVSYDGKDLSRLDLAHLRRGLGVVLQSTFLFSASVYENVACGRRIDEERVAEALEATGLARDLAGWPMGVHTIVSEGGRNLSGGQRQKLLIARALVGDPPVILLDEATSALDNVSQSAVVEALAAKRATRIVVAHRLSTIERADRVVVLDGGRVVQEGTFAELASVEGMFRSMIARQRVDAPAEARDG